GHRARGDGRHRPPPRGRRGLERRPGGRVGLPVGSLRSASGEEIGSDIPAANFVAKWDGDLPSEIVDHDFDEDAGEGVPVVSKWDSENLEPVPIFEPEGARTNNHTNVTPALQADLPGDSREERVDRTAAPSALR